MTLFDADLAAAAPEPAPPTVRVRMTVAYDGAGFAGFAVNTGVRTVGGALTAALERVLGHRVVLTCAGRTDAGVHARGQVVSFDAGAEHLDPEALQRSVNKLCSPAIAVRDVAVVDGGFDARRSARSRLYRYQVLASPVPDPALAGVAWHVDTPLTLAPMRLACDPLIGEHDFASFCRRPRRRDGEAPASLVRRVLDARWDDAGDGLLHFWIEAGSFCHQMVRSIVGTMVEVGMGKRTAGDMAAIVRRADRAGVRVVAPPHGLSLWSVQY